VGNGYSQYEVQYCQYSIRFTCFAYSFPGSVGTVQYSTNLHNGETVALKLQYVLNSLQSPDIKEQNSTGPPTSQGPLIFLSRHFREP
jgi:hypothetical protein